MNAQPQKDEASQEHYGSLDVSIWRRQIN